MPVIPDHRITAKDLDQVPAGYRGLGRCIHETQRAYLFEYYGDEIWIPKKTLVRAEGGYWAPRWAIDTSKNHRSHGEVDWTKQGVGK